MFNLTINDVINSSNGEVFLSNKMGLIVKVEESDFFDKTISIIGIKGKDINTYNQFDVFWWFDLNPEELSFMKYEPINDVLTDVFTTEYALKD